MKSFIYLVQGSAVRIDRYLPLRERPDADAVFLTYDQEREGCIYFPGSTWASGRNRLLAEAQKRGSYLYFIFMDDDVEFMRGGYDEFESLLMQLRPAAATPVFPCTRAYRIGLFNSFFVQWFYPLLKYQIFHSSDTQLIAFHNDVVQDGIVLPWIESFDSENWHLPGAIQFVMLRIFYGKALLSFNTITVSNDCHRIYPRPGGTERIDDFINRWTRAQFIKGHKPCGGTRFQLLRFFRRLLLPVKRRYFKRGVIGGIVGPIADLWEIVRQTRAYRPCTSHRVEAQFVARQLLPDSPLYARYLRHLEGDGAASG